jgi:hypothetical protein
MTIHSDRPRETELLRHRNAGTDGLDAPSYIQAGKSLLVHHQDIDLDAASLLGGAPPELGCWSAQTHKFRRCACAVRTRRSPLVVRIDRGIIVTPRRPKPSPHTYGR